MTDKPVFKSAAGEQEIMAFYDRVLAHWPVPHQQLTLPTRLGDTFVIASGDPTAPPMVLLHGSTSNSATWMGDVVAYSPLYRTCAVDIPGEPGHSARSRPAWEGEAYLEWLDDLFGALGIEQSVLIGMSLGGWMALRYAARCPERVARLVLICPSGIVPVRLSFVLRLIALSVLGRPGARAIQRAMFRGVPVDENVIAFTKLMGEHYNPRPEAPAPLPDEALARLTMPTLLVVGGKDMTSDNRKAIARMERLLPHFQAALLPDAGHVLLDTPVQVLPFLS